jgi:hypothetical protein
VSLVWTDNAATESGFRVERCRGGSCSNFSVVGQVGANVTSYADTGVSPRTRYRYRVNAWNASGASAYTNIVGVRTPR